MDSITGIGGSAAAPGLAPAQQVPYTARAIGGHNATVLDSSTADAEKTIWESEYIDVPQLNSYFNFTMDFAGQIGSGGNGDTTITLQWVEADGTVTDICALGPTVTAPNEDNKAMILKFTGRVISATKIFAAGFGTFGFGTPQYVHGAGTLAGATVDLTQAGKFRLTSDWDNTTDGADAAVNLVAAVCTVCSRAGNTPITD